jgi:DNA-directed RNA polymerase subunit E'/Rpb7
MDVFTRTLCRECIKLEPRSISKGFRAEILERLRSKVEGICSKHGYIKKGSVDIHKIAPGSVELISLCGNVVYDVYFHAEVCNPLLGSVVKANITNINRFGILAEAGYTDDNAYQSVIEIIIAKNSINIQSDVNLEELKIGQEIRVEIIGRKFELGEGKISAVGRVIKEVGAMGGPKIDEEDNEEDEVNEDDDEVSDEDENSSEANSDAEADNDEEEDDDDDQSDEFYMSDAGSVFSASSAGESISDGGSLADDAADMSSVAGSDLDD